MVRKKTLSVLVAMGLLFSSLALVASTIPDPQSSSLNAYQNISGQLNQVFHPEYLSDYPTAYHPYCMDCSSKSMVHMCMKCF